MKRSAHLLTIVLLCASACVALAQPSAEANASVEDKEIAESISSQLETAKESGKLRNFSIELTVDEGVVRLEGRAPSEQARDLIIETARRIPGVKQVVNGLIVRAAVAELAPDDLKPADEIRSFALKFADVASIASTFKQLFRADLSMASSPNDNSLIVRGPARLLAEVQDLLVQLDRAPPVEPAPATPEEAADPRSIESLREAFQSSERNAREIAAELRGERPRVDESDNSDLRSQVQESFRLRQQLHQAELAAMEQKLKQARETIAIRSRIQDDIIERRVADLMNPNLRWDSRVSGGSAGLQEQSPVTPVVRDGEIRATLTALDEDDEFVNFLQLSGTLSFPGGETKQHEFKQTAPGRYTAEFTPTRTVAALSQADTAADSLPSHLESLLKPLWPLQREREPLVATITELELMIAELQEPAKIPDDAKPETKRQLENENQRNVAKARQMQDRIDSIQAEVDAVDRQIALLKKKLVIEGMVVSIGENDTVDLSIGHDNAVRRGMRFDVLDGETFIGRVEVIKTDADQSVARIVAENANTLIRRGQRIVMPIDDRVLSELFGHDPGEPIYNDRLKRFKFQLERIDVANEYEIAEQFWLIYRGRGNPQITGVWGDPRTNSLVIVGPPDADQAIRETIAKWEGETLGIEVSEHETLEDQQKRFERFRRRVLEQIASRKLEIIDAEAGGEKPDGERLKKLNLDLQKDMAELEIVDRKLKVITESIQQLPTQSTDSEGQQ
jgi:hypothetical protein